MEYKVQGYSNRWYIIDNYKGYNLLENCTYGDETCWLVVSENAKVENRTYKKKNGEKVVLPTIIDKVYETYDSLEDALIDNDLI